MISPHTKQKLRVPSMRDLHQSDKPSVTNWCLGSCGTLLESARSVTFVPVVQQSLSWHLKTSNYRPKKKAGKAPRYMIVQQGNWLQNQNVPRALKQAGAPRLDACCLRTSIVCETQAQLATTIGLHLRSVRHG